ncbi:TPM domain-containing protein, partial [Streptomyces niveiscabiei]
GYRKAIADATAEVRAAFEIRQRLDDAEPETPPQQERMLKEIVARTAKAAGLLDEQERRFDQLRDLEQAAPAQLQALGPATEALQVRRQA